jgi:hypothetical protein
MGGPRAADRAARGRPDRRGGWPAAGRAAQSGTSDSGANPDNVVPASSGDHLVVLDWENAGPLDPGCELGYALFAWSAGRGRVSTTAVTALLDGYAAALGADPALGPGMFAAAIATHLNFLFVMAEQAIAEPGHRDYCERQLSGLLHHDLDDLARFLDLAEGLLPAPPHLDLQPPRPMPLLSPSPRALNDSYGPATPIGRQQRTDDTIRGVKRLTAVCLKCYVCWY